jgi:glycosyltransferase involved in cell wall biosynthesis
MKVLWASHSAGLAGAERALLEGVKGLSSDEVSINVVVPARGPLVSALTSLSVPLSVIRYDGWMSPSGWKSLYFRTGHCARNFTVWPKVLRLLKHVKPDLVVTNTLTIPVWALASKHLGLPHVWYVHESGCAEDVAFDLGAQWSFKLIAGLSDLIIVNSKAAAASMSQQMPNARIRLARYAVETPDRPQGGKARGDVFRLGLVGRVSPNKGQAEAIEAMALLIGRGMNVHLRIVGDVDCSFSRLLRHRTKELALAGNVEFVDFTDDPFRHLTDVDLALMCSRREAFGRVTIEAMKMGKPVVGAAVDGTKELIRDGFNGFLYEAGNANDLADKITRLYHDHEKLTSMGEEARQWARAHFTITGYANDLARIFTEAISTSATEN